MKEKRDHYESDGIEVFDVIEAFDLNFNLGNVIKYICRAGRKTFDPLPDLRKACTYLEREIERLESDPIMNNDESDPIMNNEKSDHIMTNDEKLKALMDSEIDGFVIQYGLMSNDEKRKALMDSEIDGLCIRYSLSDAAKRAIKKICEFGKHHDIKQVEIYFDSPDSSE